MDFEYPNDYTSFDLNSVQSFLENFYEGIFNFCSYMLEKYDMEIA